MNCNSCTKINALPDCLEMYASMVLDGITFPDNSGDEIVMKITNTATRQVWYVTFTDGDDIDLSSVYPLLQHYYKIEFMSDGVPVQFLITNPDTTTVEACCIEFIPSQGLQWNGSDYTISTTTCTV